MEKLRKWLDIVAGVAVIVAVAVFIWDRFAPKSGAEIPVPKALVQVDDLPFEGMKKEGQVAILEFSDFECPFCAQFATKVLPELRKAIVIDGGLLFFEHYPLSVHAKALDAAKAATCSGGEFWPTHDLIFRQQDDLAHLSVWPELAKYQPCIQDGETTKIVQGQIARATKLGVRWTPSFFVGTYEHGGLRVTKTLHGAWPLETYTDALNTLRKGHP